MRGAERCGLPKLADEHVRLPASKDGTGAFPATKPTSMVGGMAAGADSIDDMDRLRHGADQAAYVDIDDTIAAPTATPNRAPTTDTARSRA